MNSIPAAPPLPSYPGFNVPGYCRLLHALPDDEKKQLEAEKSAIIDQEVNGFAFSINNCYPVLVINTDLARRVTLTALKALERGLITLNQLASFQLLDSALRDLVTHSTFYQVRKVVIHGKLERYTSACTPDRVDDNELRKYIGDVIKQYSYDTILKIDSDLLSKWESMPTLPLLQSFFNFNNDQWKAFCDILKDKPKSEQMYYTVNAPCIGCWSAIVTRIQEIIHPLQVQRIFIKHSEGIMTESLMLVPSFSMLQAFVDVYAQSNGRKPPQLLPTYYRLGDKDYARVKTSGQIPISLYFPEASKEIRYQWSNPQFKGEIDGFDGEGPFASALHDVYHALREMEMTEQVRDACYYLANLAEHHPKNSIDEHTKPVSDTLIDGELILGHFKVPVFKSNNLEANPFDFKFGDIFYFRTVKGRLHEDLKKDMIKDMVVHPQRWKEHFGLGREDLREAEQQIYDSCSKA